MSLEGRGILEPAREFETWREQPWRIRAAQRAGLSRRGRGAGPRSSPRELARDRGPDQGNPMRKLWRFYASLVCKSHPGFEARHFGRNPLGGQE